MIDILANFHFIRPWWLLSLLPALLLLLLLWRNVRGGQGWQQVIDPALLPHLLDQQTIASSRSPFPALLLTWVIAALALAGPSWEKIPQPILQKQDALVLVLDLSFSMYVEDLQPNRLQRAERKLLDLLDTRVEGTTALLAYAGDSHVVSPLTDDTSTIANLLPALSPGIMPLKGNNPQLAIAQAITLLQAAAAPDGHIVLVTDGIRERDVGAITKLLQPHNISLSVLGVGTSDGGPIPTGDAGLLKDANGSIVIASLERRPLRQLASANQGRYADISLGDSDLEQVLARPLSYWIGVPTPGTTWVTGSLWHWCPQHSWPFGAAGYWVLLYC